MLAAAADLHILPHGGQIVIHCPVHYGRQQVHHVTHVGLIAPQQRGGETLQGTHESLFDSARHELLRKENPEEAAARLASESKDLRQSVR